MFRKIFFLPFFFCLGESQKHVHTRLTRLTERLKDHSPIFFAHKTSNSKTSLETVTLKKRFFSEENIKNFTDQLSLLSWDNLNYTNNVNDLFHNFFSTFYNVYDVNFPIKEIKIKRKDLNSLWITNGLKKSSKRKQKLNIRYLKSRSDSALQAYKSYKSLFEKLRKRAKRNYFSSLLSKYQGNIKKHGLL